MITSSPVATSMAVTRSTRSGHSREGSRCPITALRSGSATVSAAIAMAPRVAELMARELQNGDAWSAAQVTALQALAKGYLVS